MYPNQCANSNKFEEDHSNILIGIAADRVIPEMSSSLDQSANRTFTRDLYRIFPVPCQYFA